jgi:ABC-type multidrug transport system fused ATPase/permease subunit
MPSDCLPTSSTVGALGDLMVRLTEDVAVIEGVTASGALGAVTSEVSAMAFAVTFDNVRFTHLQTDGAVLRHLSFHAESGQLVGVIGPSGSGKSTIGKLLLRLLRP